MDFVLVCLNEQIGCIALFVQRHSELTSLAEEVINL